MFVPRSAAQVWAVRCWSIKLRQLRQMAMPKGLVRVRYYGLLASGNRKGLAQHAASR